MSLSGSIDIAFSKASEASLEVSNVSREIPRVTSLKFSMSDRQNDKLCYKKGCGRRSLRVIPEPALDDPLLAQAFRFVGLDPAQGFQQRVGVLAQQGRTTDRDG